MVDEQNQNIIATHPVEGAKVGFPSQLFEVRFELSARASQMSRVSVIGGRGS